MRATEIGVDARAVVAEYLKLETTNNGEASLLYPITGVRIYPVGLPTGFLHSDDAVVVRFRSDEEIAGTSVGRSSIEFRAYGDTADPDSAVSVALALRRQLRLASDEHVASGVLMSVQMEGGSGELIRTPSGVRPWIPIFAQALTKP